MHISGQTGHKKQIKIRMCVHVPVFHAWRLNDLYILTSVMSRWMCFNADCFFVFFFYVVVLVFFVWLTLITRQQGLNRTDALCPEVLQHFNLKKWTSEWMSWWINEWMEVCAVCWRMGELYEWPLHSSIKKRLCWFSRGFLYSFVSQIALHVFLYSLNLFVRWLFFNQGLFNRITKWHNVK